MEQHGKREARPELNEGRRKLLKAAAIAGGAAVAAGALPAEWKKPLATVAGLPAHAQTSEAPIILSDLGNFEWAGDVREGGDTPSSRWPVAGEVVFQDPLGGIDADALITVWSTQQRCGDLQFTEKLGENGYQLLSGDPSGGRIRFYFTGCCDEGTVSVQLSSGTRRSNKLGAPINMPC